MDQKLIVIGKRSFLAKSYWENRQVLNNQLEIEMVDTKDFILDNYAADKSCKFFCIFNSSITPQNAYSEETDNKDKFISTINKIYDSHPDSIIVYPSSAGTIYTGNEKVFSETSASEGVNAYGKVKKWEEDFIKAKFKNYLILRYSAIYGQNQRLGKKQGVINEWINAMNLNKSIEVFGNYLQKRDYIYSEDAAKISLQLINKHIGPEVYNISNGISHSLLEIKEFIENLAQRKFVKIDFNANSEDSADLFISNQKSITDSGYTSLTDIEDGIKKLWRLTIEET
jgi:nucleoside-diphosphate-sugar epimerase